MTAPRRLPFASTLRSVQRAIGTASVARSLGARHAELSVISSLDDVKGRATSPLLRMAIEAATVAIDIDLAPVADRCRDELDARLVQQWPGEHYRLLAALVEVLRPAHVVEIGTATGLSALALLARGAARVTTYDIVHWRSFPGAVLEAGDFGPRLEQRLGDLAGQEFFEDQADTLSDAGLIFVDGPKDGVFEPALLRRLLPLLARRKSLVILDDIRLPNMVALWRSIDQPALDLTSFGHWSGTGLVLTGPER